MKKIIVLSVILFCVSCIKEKKGSRFLISEKQIVSSNGIDSECAFFSNGLEKDRYLSWTEEQNGRTVLVYRKFDGVNFLEKVTVSSTYGLQSHHESMAKIGVTGEGVLFCLFRVSSPTKYNKYAGNLFYTTSKDNGKNWSEKAKLVDEKKSTSQSFFDIERMNDGELAIVWLDNRFSTKEKRGSTLFFNRTHSGKILQTEKSIAYNTCQCCRTDLLIDKNKIKIAFRNIIDNSIRDMFYVSSDNNGEYFEEPRRISADDWEIDGCPHTGPSLATGKTTAAVWFTAGKGNKGLFFAEKEAGEQEFGKRLEISENGNHPQLIFLNEVYYIVYDEYYQKDNTTYQQIKLHKKNIFASDEIISVSNAFAMNTFPVVTKISENELLIAWTNLDGEKRQIEVVNVKI